MQRPIRIGTRGSQLARWQADWVASQLEGHGYQAEIVEISTTGDAQQVNPVAAIGTQGVFTKEVQRAVLDGAADIAVHSLKDLPTEPTPGLTLAAVPPREDCRDALVSAGGLTLDRLPSGARVGTGSQRRRALLLAARPDLAVQPIRGNVDTRLTKLDAGDYDAVVLASAGLRRLGFDDRIAELLGPPVMLPAPGQGALGIECLADGDAVDATQLLDDDPTHAAVEAERALLAELHGGCSVPVGAWGRIESGTLHLDAVVASIDGKVDLRAAGNAPPNDPAALGRSVASELLAQGAAEVIAACRDASA